jgi:hypothetical protein
LLICSSNAGSAQSGGSGQDHHIATDKNVKGGYTARLKAIFDKAGMNISNDAENIIEDMPGHGGNHPPEYHQWVLDRLTAATDGLSGDQAKAALTNELQAIRQDLSANPDLIKWSYWRQ